MRSNPILSESNLTFLVAIAAQLRLGRSNHTYLRTFLGGNACHSRTLTTFAHRQSKGQAWEQAQSKTRAERRQERGPPAVSPDLRIEVDRRGPVRVPIRHVGMFRRPVSLLFQIYLVC